MSRRIHLLPLISSCLGDRGATGLKGARGISGIPGENGEPGIPGQSGMKGQKGENGQTTCYVTERGRRLEKPCSDASLDQERRDESSGGMGGLTYVRWGRTTCPVGDARIVYSGNKAYYNRLINGCTPQFKVPFWFFENEKLEIPSCPNHKWHKQKNIDLARSKIGAPLLSPCILLDNSILLLVLTSSDFFLS